MKPESWTPPSEWSVITTIDAHTGGEPFRIVTGGLPEPSGETILAKRRDAMTRLDDARKILMWEPRGHADMYGCIVTKPVSDDAQFGVLFMHNEGWSTMCGHGVIAMATVAVETGMVAATDRDTRVSIDSPAGLVHAVVERLPERQTIVRFRNVPSFVDALDEVVTVAGLGSVRYDLAFGGAYYAFVDDDGPLVPARAGELIEKGRAIKRAIAETRRIVHPEEEDLGFLYGVIFVGPPEDRRNHSRNVCVFADGEIDRSPTGTGVSARLAIQSARGDLRVAETIRVESILGSVFEGRVAELSRVDDTERVIPEISGNAFITGRHEFFIDPNDQIGRGFLVR